MLLAASRLRQDLTQPAAPAHTCLYQRLPTTMLRSSAQSVRRGWPLQAVLRQPRVRLVQGSQQDVLGTC